MCRFVNRHLRKKLVGSKKSREVWLMEDDKNTNLFHKMAYANRKNDLLSKGQN